MSNFVIPLKLDSEFASDDRSRYDLSVDLVENSQLVGNDIPAGGVCKISSITPAGNRPNVDGAQADSKANAQSVCVALGTIAANNGTGLAQFSGIVDLPTTTWDNVLPVTERGSGLNPGKLYYIDPVNKYFLTEVQPNTAGDEIAPIGTALTPRKLKYNKQTTITKE